MKAGETLNIVQKLNLTKPYDVVRFRLSNGINTITKDLTEDSGGVFVIPLYQEDTHKLEGRVSIEAEVDFEDKSVRYSNFNDIYLNKTLGYDPVENNQPSDDDGVDLIMESIEQGVAVVISPESAEELITRVTELFQDTKDIAQSVRDDADRGEFDGFSPQVTVKTQTPSTYVLHIKDADHEYDTPNLQGQGGEGSIEVGDGLKREGNVVSVDNGNFLYFANNKLTVSLSSLGASALRQWLADTNYLSAYKPLATREYVDSLISTSLKRLVVQSLPTHDIDEHTIYMVLATTPTTNNIYNEYMYINGAWELIGTTEVDLSNYYTKVQTNDLLDVKVDKVQSLNNLVEFYSGSSNDIDVTNYSYITFDKELQDGDELTLYKSVDGVWHQEDITDSWYAYIFDADEIYFVLDTSASSGTREVRYSLFNDVIRQRQYSREIGELQNGKADKSTTYTKTEVDTALGNKQNIINAQNKLNADLVDDTSSDNKFVTLTDIIAWNNKQEPISQNNKLNADYVDDTNATNKFTNTTEKQTWNAKADNTTISTDTTSTTVSLTLADNHEYRYTQELTSLTLTMPSGDFISSIVFASGSTPTSMTYDSNIKWSGDDVTNGQFVPSADKDYDIMMYYNGLNVNGIVRGV